MTAWHCQYPDHQGDRTVATAAGRYTKRVTYMRSDGKRRVHETVVPEGNRCRLCVEIEHARDFGKVNPDQGRFV